MSNIITMNSIILRGIPLMEGGNSLFEVAKLTGDPMVLTLHDALGASILKLTSEESVRKELVTTFKSEGVEGVSRIMKSLPKEGQQDIERQARRFMTDAKALIEVMGTKQKQAPAKEPEEVCEEYVLYRHPDLDGELVGDGVIMGKKCGLSLKGIPENGETGKFFDAARNSQGNGSHMILSKRDVLIQAWHDEDVAREEAKTSRKRHYGFMSESPGDSGDESIGSEEGKRELREEVRIAVQKRAERFMEDAKVLIRRLRK